MQLGAYLSRTAIPERRDRQQHTVVGARVDRVALRSRYNEMAGKILCLFLWEKKWWMDTYRDSFIESCKGLYASKRPIKIALQELHSHVAWDWVETGILF